MVRISYLRVSLRSIFPSCPPPSIPKVKSVEKSLQKLNESVKLNIYNNTVEDIFVDGKKVRGSLIRVEDKNMYIYDDKEDKFKVINLKENKEVFSEKITGNIRSTYFKDDKLYMNIWKDKKMYMYIYDVKTNKIIEKKEFKVDENRDNMIFPITK